ncbi:MAG: class B sortase [Oscillospiraceae bacterium]|nr:class B sortase [Oscillospiraceae bacterium]
MTAENNRDLPLEDPYEIARSFSEQGSAPAAGPEADMPVELIQKRSDDGIFDYSPEREDEMNENKNVSAGPKKDALPYRVLTSVVPIIGDRPLEMVRKLIFMIAVVCLIGSVAMITNEAYIIPKDNEEVYESLLQIYQDTHKIEGESTGSDGQKKPSGSGYIYLSFQEIYQKNNDTAGWLRYKSSTGSDFLGINYVVMQTNNNDYYLNRDYLRNYNKNGALFFDKNHRVTPAGLPDFTIIYGHNMNSGQMFGGISKLINKGNYIGTTGLRYIRTAPVMWLRTIYDEKEVPYKVFAVMISDADAIITGDFNYAPSSIGSAQSKEYYIANVRLRSVFNFAGVDVNVSDKLLVLSTCSIKSRVGFENSRIAVIARAVRPGESTSVNADTITAAANPVMPRAWYTSQNLKLHDYYANPDKYVTYPAATPTAETAASTTAGKPTNNTTKKPPSSQTRTTATTKAVAPQPTSPAVVTTRPPTKPPVTTSQTANPSTTVTTVGETIADTVTTNPPPTDPPTTDPPATEPSDPPATEPVETISE